MSKSIVLIFITLLLIACGKSKQTESNETDSLTPFEMTIGSDAHLTTEDRQKLANAKGRSVQQLSITALQDQINEARGKVHLFNFWKLSDEHSLKMNEALEKIALQLSDQVNVILVNLDTIEQQKTVNTYLRSQGITTPAFQLIKEKDWSKKIDANWSGDGPYLMMINQDNSTFLPYQQPLSYEAIFAILQPLMNH